MSFQLNPLLETRFITTVHDVRRADKLAKQRANKTGEKYSPTWYRNKKERKLFKQALNDVKNDRYEV